MNPLAVYRWSDVPKLLGLAVLYALLIQLVLSHLTTDGNISPVWIPSGLGLAALMLGGKKYWPGIFIGAMGAYLAVGRSIPVSFFIASSRIVTVSIFTLARSSKREIVDALYRQVTCSSVQ